MAEDVFKHDFKYYKSRVPPPDTSFVIDLHNPKCNKCDKLQIEVIVDNSSKQKLQEYGLIPSEQWQAFTFSSQKGLIYINNPFSSIGQRYWTMRCLRDFPKKPHKLNLDIHGDLSDDTDWWNSCHTSDEKKNIALKKKLRWCTLGYHHNWDTKHYTEENRHSFPHDLAELCKIISKCCGFDEFIPQASIVNYYHMDSTLAPHTDHSEKNLDAPLLSLSFGQSAIFLIGGESKEIKPTALYIHSGDIIIMSKESRLCYHAVPRVTPAMIEPWRKINQDPSGVLNLNNFKTIGNHFTKDDICNEEFWEPFEEYLNYSRININVRQVLYKNQQYLDDNR